MRKQVKKAPKPEATNKDRLMHVMARLSEQLRSENHPEAIDQWCADLDGWLSDLACDDAFGTEGQCDPRGDMREGEWTVFRVQGIDK